MYLGTPKKWLHFPLFELKSAPYIPLVTECKAK